MNKTGQYQIEKLIEIDDSRFRNLLRFCNESGLFLKPVSEGYRTIETSYALVNAPQIKLRILHSPELKQQGMFWEYQFNSLLFEEVLNILPHDIAIELLYHIDLLGN